MLLNLLGLTASIISFVLWFPQAMQTWRVRNDPQAMAGISVGTQWLLVANAIIWASYAVLAHAWWSGVPSLVNLPLALGTLYLIYRTRRLLGVDEDPVPAEAGLSLVRTVDRPEPFQARSAS